MIRTPFGSKYTLGDLFSADGTFQHTIILGNGGDFLNSLARSIQSTLNVNGQKDRVQIVPSHEAKEIHKYSSNVTEIHFNTGPVDVYGTELYISSSRNPNDVDIRLMNSMSKYWLNKGIRKTDSIVYGRDNYRRLHLCNLSNVKDVEILRNYLSEITIELLYGITGVRTSHSVPEGNTTIFY